jgi:hypothetical protein
VPIYYESRLVKLEMDSAVTGSIDEEVEDLTEDEEEAARARTKSRWAALEKLWRHPRVLRRWRQTWCSTSRRGKTRCAARQ